MAGTSPAMTTAWSVQRHRELGIPVVRLDPWRRTAERREGDLRAVLSGRTGRRRRRLARLRVERLAERGSPGLHQHALVARRRDGEADAMQVRLAVAEHRQIGAILHRQVGQHLEYGTFCCAVETADQFLGNLLVVIDLRRRSEGGQRFHGFASCKSTALNIYPPG